MQDTEPKFEYNLKLTPVENYTEFQRAISMQKGVLFTESRDISGNPILFMYHLPGLKLNLKEIEKTYAGFNHKLVDHVSSIINNHEDAFQIFTATYDIYNRVRTDVNNMYRTNAFPFVGKTTSKKLKDIRQMGILPVTARFNGSVTEWTEDIPKAVTFEQLGTELKEFINRTIELWLKYTKRLVKRLEKLLVGLFHDKRIQHFRYVGSVADIVEIATAITLSGNLKVFGKKELTPNQFAKILGLFLGIEIKNVKDHNTTLIARYKNNKSFLEESGKKVNDFVTNFL